MRCLQCGHVVEQECPWLSENRQIKLLAQEAARDAREALKTADQATISAQAARIAELEDKRDELGYRLIAMEAEFPNDYDFEQLWKSYALADDDSLSTTARELKWRLRAMVGIDALDVQVSVLRELLRPFADYALLFDRLRGDGVEDDTITLCGFVESKPVALRVGDFMKARVALSAAPSDAI